MGDEVVTTPFGKFLVNPAECIGATVKAGTVWDGPGFLQVIAREYARFGEVGTTVIDVGAHLGDWVVWLAGQGAWRVIACEAAPEMISTLKANLDMNKAMCADTVILLPVAAFDVHTRLQWTKPYDVQDSGSAALQEGAGEIPAVPLDDYRDLFGARVSLIKVDAQGCDFAALIGLRQTIERDHPVIVFEWEAEMAKVHGHTFADVERWLTARGYTVREWPSHALNYLCVWQGGGR